MVILTLHLHPHSTARSVMVFLFHYLAQVNQINHLDYKAGTNAHNRYMQTQPMSQQTLQDPEFSKAIFPFKLEH